MNEIWILFYYNSLPDMPLGCRLFSNEIIKRDFLMCNPTNTGHYQYPKFETLSYDCGCHSREVKRILEREEPDKYVIFYTRHTTSSVSSNKVIGYFKAGKISKKIDGFVAENAVLLPRSKCIPIKYNRRGVPVSWGHSSIRIKIGSILKDLKKNHKFDISKKYQNETNRIMKLLESPKGRDEIIKCCKECDVKKKCYWGIKSEDAKMEMLRKYAQNSKCS